MDLPSAVPNLALILPLPSTSSVNLGQESHEGTGHCRSPRPQPPHMLGLEALAGAIRLSASPGGSAAGSAGDPLTGQGPAQQVGERHDPAGAWLHPVCTQTQELGKGAALSLMLGLSAGGRARIAGAVPTWGLARAPRLCRDPLASGVQAGKLGAACCAGSGGVQLGSTVSPEPHPSALQAKGLGQHSNSQPVPKSPGCHFRLCGDTRTLSTRLGCERQSL